MRTLLKLWLAPITRLANCEEILPPPGLIGRESNGDKFEVDGNKDWCGWIIDTEAGGATRELENFEVDPSGKMIFGCGICPPYA